MSNRRKTCIAAGKRIINDDHAMALAGYHVEHSYMNESSIMSVNEYDSFDDTVVRKWKKEGVSCKEIIKRKMKQAQNNVDEVQKRLDDAMNGAETFAQLLANLEPRKENQFAIPKLPGVRNEENSIIRSPAATKSSGRAGLSCSTPKGANVTLRSLKCLDISQVINTEKLDMNMANNVHNTTVTIPVLNDEVNCAKTISIDDANSNSDFHRKTQGIVREEENSMKSTFTIQKESTNSGTFTITRGSKNESELQRTFTIENMNEKEVSMASNETIVVDKKSEKEKVLKKPKKTSLEARERRNATLGNDMLSSFLGETPSPGARLFVRNRKKMRPSVATPPMNILSNRLSIDSNKEKTIEMMTLSEEVDDAHATVSYVDAVTEQYNDSINGDAVNNKTRIIMNTPNKRQLIRTPIERSRANMSNCHVLPIIGVDMVTPYAKTSDVTDSQKSHNYEKPTIASLNRSVKSYTKGSAKSCKGIPLSQRLEMDVDEEPVIVNVHVHPGSVPMSFDNEEEEVEMQSEIREKVKEAEENEEENVEILEDSLHKLCVDDNMGGPSNSYVQPTHFPNLIDDSIATVNTPPIHRNRRIVDYSPVDDETNIKITRRKEKFKGEKKNTKIEPMVLAKRELIKPKDDEIIGLRRSTRTRCMPVRSWLGELPIYVYSPSGGRRMAGVTDVTISDKRYCKYRTADPRLATERQHEEMAIKRARAERRREQLRKDHANGKRLNVTQEEIVTSDEES